MANLGINTFLWTTQWRDAETAACIFAQIRGIGFDSVQIPLLSIDAFDPETIARLLDEVGLGCYISAGLTLKTDITSNSSKVRRRGIEYLKGCVRIAHRMGCPFLSGSFHSVFGKKAESLVGEREWEYSAECLAEVAREARALEMDLALEPINRYESFLINTASQARRLIGMIGAPNIKLQLDTFHMNLEEESYRETIVETGAELIHFHVAENHRGRFGRGMTPWDEIFGALSEIGYQGAIVIESCVPEVAAVAKAACIWRQMASSADALASEGLTFLKEMAKKHRL